MSDVRDGPGARDSAGSSDAPGTASAPGARDTALPPHVPERRAHVRWERVTQWPLAVAAAVFLLAYSVEVLADLHGAASTAAEAAINITWAMFLVDYVVQLGLARHRGRWFIRHLPDLAAIALPVLRPLRLLRLVQLLRILQRTTGAAIRGRVIVYVLVTTALLVYVAALAMLDVERRAPHATITSIGDALWWAVVTITTVGYGDITPVTTAGRFIAVGVMIGGIALVGVVTATIASWIIEQVGRRDASSQAATRKEIEELTAEVRALRAEVRDRVARPGAQPPTPATTPAAAPATQAAPTHAPATQAPARQAPEPPTGSGPTTPSDLP